MAFPSLVQLPWAAAESFRTSACEHGPGQRYTYYHRATPLHSWDITLSAITDAELGAWKTHWDAMKGQLGTDSFTDPDSGTAYTKCRYAMEEFSFSMLGPGLNSLRVQIVEVP